ncbi:6-phosphogluconolactonase [Trichinella zimbabwensis]|uniref:6-phosphogluconolactonase n=1 Tax=Trichinella zimbabwensis TaxID=268475 RepID=A0A0V1HBB9_9BILA|nr:6-phosphogluconolactonase [Trichinella zimbabwensis]
MNFMFTLIFVVELNIQKKKKEIQVGTLVMASILFPEDRKGLAIQLGKLIHQLVEQKRLEKNYCVIGLSGGSMPDIMAEALKAVNCDFKHVWFIFCDERHVPFSSAESNFGEYQRKSTIEKSGAQFPQIDCLLLGIGPDGHICSLFPDHAALKETNRWVVPVGDSPKPPPRRVTLTLPVINNANQIVFVACGASKADIVERIINRKDPFLPAMMVKPLSGRTLFLFDKEASSKLPKLSKSEITECRSLSSTKPARWTNCGHCIPVRFEVHAFYEKMFDMVTTITNECEQFQFSRVDQLYPCSLIFYYTINATKDTHCNYILLRKLFNILCINYFIDFISSLKNMKEEWLPNPAISNPTLTKKANMPARRATLVRFRLVS